MATKHTPFSISATAGGPWYIRFVDRHGTTRLLPAFPPRFKGIFGYWKTTNCPTYDNGRVHIVHDDRGDDGDNVSPSEVLKHFEEQFNSVEEYLGYINDH